MNLRYNARTMKKFTLISLFSVLFFSCSGGDANIRIIHLIDDAPALSITLNNETVASSVAFLEDSNRVTVSTDNSSLLISNAATSSSLKNFNVSLSGGDFAIALLGSLADIQNVIYEEDLSVPAEGKGRVRIMHASDTNAASDVWGFIVNPGDDPDETSNTQIKFLTDFSFASITEGRELNAGSYRIVITEADNDANILFDSGTVALAEGEIQTFIAVDNVPGGGDAGDFHLISD